MRAAPPRSAEESPTCACSSHAPSSKDGCRIIVKRRQFDPEDLANGVDTPVIGLLPFGMDPRQAARDLAPR